MQEVTGGRPLQSKDISKLRYTEAVIRETMRMDTLLPLVVRPVQQMRLLRPGGDPLELVALSQRAIELLPQGCGSERSAARRELAP